MGSTRTSPCGEVRFARSVRQGCAAMGTRIELLLLGEDEAQLRAVGEEALEEVISLHRRLSPFERSSELSRINREAGHRWTAISGDMGELLALCVRAHAQSGGAFDPTIGPLMRAWGFRGERADPLAAMEARELVGMDKVEVDVGRGRVRFGRALMRLDLGGVAKGFALDRAADILRESGVGAAMLHGGTSSVVGIGSAGGEGGWRVRIGEANDGPVVELVDAALGVSAPHGRTIELDGRVLGHVIDPRVGEPTRGAMQAFVVGDSCAMCDAMSTALLVGQQWTAPMRGDARAMGVLRGSGGCGGWELVDDGSVIRSPASSGRSEERWA